VTAPPSSSAPTPTASLPRPATSIADIRSFNSRHDWRSTFVCTFNRIRLSSRTATSSMQLLTLPPSLLS
jgi:hypothetical protein